MLASLTLFLPQVRLYDIVSNNQRCSYSHSMPVLDCTFQDPIHVWSGGLDNTLKCYDINSSQESSLGTHENAIKCVEYSGDLNVIVTGSWDGTVKVWDQRAGNPCTGVYSQPDKVYTMSVAGEKLVVGTAGRKVRQQQHGTVTYSASWCRCGCGT